MEPATFILFFNFVLVLPITNFRFFLSINIPYVHAQGISKVTEIDEIKLIEIYQDFSLVKIGLT